MAGIVYQGLDYASVLSVMELFELNDMKAAFDDIRAMEQTALQVLNRQT